LPPSQNPTCINWSREVYQPNCAQYDGQQPGFIQRSTDGSIIQGNCSPNPPGYPLDFVCSRYQGRTTCYSSDGRQTNSYREICCPQGSQQTQPYYCRGADINSCALVLDRQQGVADAASHFANMNTCRRNCT
jgi:hypothetical protein